MRKTNKNVQKPCINCKYFIACGETTRTAKCEGRELKEKKKKKGLMI